MKMLRPLLFILLSLGGVIAHAGVNIVATTPDLGALAKAVGGPDATVTVLARATEDPHFVDARPSFIRLLNQADLLVEGGAELEQGWLPPLINNARNARILPGAPGHFRAAAGLILRDIPQVLDRSQGDVHPSGNPHFLLDPANAVQVAQRLAIRLGEIDPAHADTYQERANTFRVVLDKQLPLWKKRLAPFRGAGVVTYHKSFDYFLAAFDLNLAGTLEPKPGIEPSSSHLVALVTRMKAQGTKLIIAEPNRPDRLCERVARESGAQLLRLPLMPGSVNGTDDYIAFIEYNVTAVENALHALARP